VSVVDVAVPCQRAVCVEPAYLPRFHCIFKRAFRNCVKSTRQSAVSAGPEARRPISLFGARYPNVSRVIARASVAGRRGQSRLLSYLPPNVNLPQRQLAPTSLYHSEQ
jgi:hypothetical protein